MQHKRPDPIGPHDLGGLEAGALERAEHDVAWWERQVDAMIILLLERGVMKDVSQLRNGIERLGPDAYERLSYYERWAASAAAIAIEAGVVSEQELEERIADIRSREARGVSRFQVGERVRIDDRSEARHHRVPAYVKGRCGEVVRVCRPGEPPEALAAGLVGAPQVPVYRVRLRQHDLWTGYRGGPTDSLDIEIYEHWLEPKG